MIMKKRKCLLCGELIPKHRENKLCERANPPRYNRWTHTFTKAGIEEIEVVEARIAGEYYEMDCGG